METPAVAHPWRADKFSRRDRSRHRQGVDRNQGGSSRQPTKSKWVQIDGKWISSATAAQESQSGPAKSQPAIECSKASTKALPRKSKEVVRAQHQGKNMEQLQALPRKSKEVVRAQHQGKNMEQLQASKVPAAPVRAFSESPRSPRSSTQGRSKSLPGGNHREFIEASIEAAVSQLRLELDVLVESLLETAQQAHEAGSAKPEHVSSFRQGYSKTIRLLQEVNPVQDPAPELALSLILTALSKNKNGGSVPEKSSPPPGFTRPSIVANLPTPFRNAESAAGPRMQEERDLRGNAVGWTLLGAHVQPFTSPQGMYCNDHMESQSHVNQHSTYSAQTLRGSARYVANDAAGWNSAAREVGFPDFGSCPRSPRKKKVTVINPRTGEKLVISSVVPFSWRRSCRLRILNPKTGEEVLPLVTLGNGQSCQDDGQRTSRLSIARSDQSLTPARQSRQSRSQQSPTPVRQQRRSLAGGTIKEGSCWFLEPASGGHWDWPLSRQEKKDRVLLLSQLELLSQIEELEARSEPHVV
eukprot:TRINITY_DN93_c0_g1_i1.p1 TRINITY_DN93_c0_g1~~TRINITY_DN93_c0_g1_i1.p1  ORF type:complete len:526 (-),score=81.13 TRINITY_DN93_c0_g1_i1:156-1733(-)